MKKTRFTLMPVLGSFFLTAFFFLAVSSDVSAQAMACNNLVQVSVEPTANTCQATITADMILEGTPIAGHNYQIEIKEGFVVIASGVNTVLLTNSSQWFGSTLTVVITDLSNGNSCWGQMIIEDKLAPVITCTNVTIGCWEDPDEVAAPTAVDNCDATPEIVLTGEIVNGANVCATGFATIVRTYKAIDNWGNTSATCTQTITVTRPTVIDFPNDIAWTCEQYAAFPNITAATPLHPYITDTDLSTNLIIDVNLNPDCDDDDLPGTDNPAINSTNTSNGGLGCPGNGLDDADVLALTGSGIVHNIQGEHCKYQSSHSDQVLPTCGNTFKIVRTWTVLNWCTGQIVTSGVGGEDNIQVIKLVDKIAPTITISSPITISANIPGQHPQVCRSTECLPPPTVSDNCSSSVTWKIYTPVGEATSTQGCGGGRRIPLPGLPIGTHNVTYQATDACGNQTNIVVQVIVTDLEAPIAICDEITDVALGSDGFATVFANTYDDGTWDNCCLDHFEVRRMTDPCNDGHDDLVFGPSVRFCCADLNSSSVQVVFRAFDCEDNYNDCMVSVQVNDKLPPILTNCPANQRITCDWYSQNLEAALYAIENNQNLTPAQKDEQQNAILTPHFGTATFADNCTAIITAQVTLNIDQCLEGAIIRTFTARDSKNNNATQSCTQTIFVDHVSDWVVEFPADITVNCGTTPPAFGEPAIFFETCELVAVSHDDQLFTVVPDACYKIVRTWSVINWCVVGANVDQEVVESSELAFQQAFPAEPCDFNGVNGCNNRTFRDSWRVSPKSKPGAANATQSTSPDTDPDSDPWDGYITYQQVIKVQDTVDPVFTNNCTVPDICLTGNTCTGTITLPIPGVTECSPTLTWTVTSPFGSGFGPFNNVAPGTYNVTYNVMDNCNNQTSCNTTVKVKDCKLPTPYCKAGIVVELMVVQPPMVQVWANDLNAGSFDNCPGALKFSFSADVNDIGRVYTCANVGANQDTMWVTDAAGNQDFCITTVTIQANQQQCGSGNLVATSGAIATEMNQGVDNVSVSLSGQSSGNMMTNQAGAYSFGSIPTGNDITVTPLKDDAPLNGVSTYDMVLISKHILGVQALNSPYKLIAADANHSGTVTTFDLLEIRKLILQITSNFTNNTSWRFVDKDYVFPNPANPWQEMFPEVININNIPSSVLDADFVAVKIGDVNNSAVTFAGSNEDRSIYGTFALTTQDLNVTVGEEVRMMFTGTEKALGYQFTLSFDRTALEFVEVQPGILKDENFGFALLDKGALTASWNQLAGGSEQLAMAGEQHFTLVFNAKRAGKLSDLVSLNSRFTNAEAYNLEGELLDMHLQFNGKQAGIFELYQNTPNPFRGLTTIGFQLPESGLAKLAVVDISGKTLKIVEEDFAKGYNEVILNRSELPASGVLYYTLETATNTATRKMVIIE